MGNVYDKCKDCCLDVNKKRNDNEANHFEYIKNNLGKSLNDITQTINGLKSWEQLINLNENDVEKNENEVLVEPKCRNFLEMFVIIGFVFCLIQLIGVQIFIILLNSLFDEIVDEIKLWFDNTPREYNFYQKIEINSFKELPEIDVAMIASSIGIIILKNFGFICTSITFELLNLIYFTIFLYFFEFHEGQELAENYTRLEILVLIISYIVLSLAVGCISTIGIKEYFNLYSIYFKPGDEKDTEKIFFYVFSGLSVFIAIIINRKIFTSFKKITDKKLLMWILIVCLISFVLSMVIHGLYIIPTSKKKENLRKEKAQENQIKNENNKKLEIIDNIIETDKNICSKDNEINIEDIEEVKENKNNNGNINKDFVYKKAITHNENESLKSKNSQADLTNEEGQKQNEDNKEYSSKLCTLCGYVYIQNEKDGQSTCVCYYYTDKSTWCTEKMTNFNVLASFLTLLYSQSCILGFNLILTDRVLYDYSYKKNIIFYLVLILISVGSWCFYILIFNLNQKPKGKEETQEQNQNQIDGKDPKWETAKKYFKAISLISFGYTCFTLIASIFYLVEDDVTKERWNNILMAEFIIFKIIDLIVLSFFDFFDNSDIFNSTLAITLEKFFWMIIETLIESLVENKKYLIKFQLILTSIVLAIFIILWLARTFCHKEKDGQK